MCSLADFHHVQFTVSNALQSSYWYCCCFGFERFAQKIDEHSTSIAVRNGKATFVFTSLSSFSEEERNQLIIHGDCIRDVALRVDDLDNVLESLAAHPVELYEQPSIISDQYGSVRCAKIRSQDTDVIHSLLYTSEYSGIFLPNYEPIDNYPILHLRDPIPVELLDHVVQNYPIDSIETTAEWYRSTLQLQRFWSVDDTVATSEFSAIKAWLITNPDRKVQLTLAESVKGHKGRSQIQEFVDFNGGSGIQHIALRVDDIISTVTLMKERSLEFLTVPSTYYDVLEERLAGSTLDFREDMQKLRELSILMDFDEHGYLLQIFTKPVQDRPTLFVEIIQRRNFNGFGAGNFKALFEAVEREQKLRGTL